ncbi:MAG: hypothetical protein K6F77_08710 [Lachnospiraceae bacterium]|nr:hypothetical protein [Lachnospiraceae bacterium]
MIRRNLLNNNLIKKIAGTFIVLAMGITSVGSMPKTVLADKTETTSTEKTSTEKTSTEVASNETDNEVAEQNLIEDDKGRVVIWEWKAVNANNINSVLNEAGKDKAIPSIFALTDREGYPNGYFLSLYDDENHIFHGDGSMSASSWDNESVLMNSYFKYDEAFNKFNILPNFNETMMHICLGSFNSKEINLTKNMDQHRSMYLMISDEAGSIDKDNFDKDTFMTSGNCKGCLWVKPISWQTTGESYNAIEEFFGKENWANNTLMSEIMLSKYNYKVDTSDMSYNRIYDEENPELDKNGKIANECYDTTSYHLRIPYTVRENGGFAEENEPSLQLSKVAWNPSKFEANGVIAGGAGAAKAVQLQIGSVDQTNLNTAYKGSYKKDYLYFIGSDGWINDDDRERYYLTTKGGLVFAQSGDSLNNVIWKYRWYVGFQHVYSTVKGVGGDKTTGEGGVTTIGNGSMFVVGGKETYLDENGNTCKAEGIILPEHSKIIVEEGGVLAVEGNLINNGKIINKGGTIVVKQGGSISSFTETTEGTIECCQGKTGKSGQMIIMPDSKVYALTSQEMLNSPANFYKKLTDKGGSYTDLSNSVILTGGATITNYGDFEVTSINIDSTSKVENRGSSLFRVGYARASDSYLMYKDDDKDKIVKADFKEINTAYDEEKANNSNAGITSVNGTASSSAGGVLESSYMKFLTKLTKLYGIKAIVTSDSSKPVISTEKNAKVEFADGADSDNKSINFVEVEY